MAIKFKVLAFYRNLLKPWERAKVKTSREIHDKLVERFTQVFMVGESAVLRYKLPRYEVFDTEFIHVGLRVRLSKRQIAKFRKCGVIVHYMTSFTPLDALLFLLVKDNPISLICTFNDALNKKLFTLEDIEERLAGPSFKGVQVLTEIYPYLTADFDSEFETLFNLGVVLLGYRPLESQIVIGNNRADFRCGMFLIECDGMAKYDGETYSRETVEQIKHEHLRDSNYALHGFKTLHVHWEDMYTSRLERVLIQIRAPKDRKRSHHLQRLVINYLENKGPWRRPR
jgi:hypothetical protein